MTETEALILLGLDADEVTLARVREARITHAKLVHPDRQQEGLKAAATSHLQRVNAAADLLERLLKERGHGARYEGNATGQAAGADPPSGDSTTGLTVTCPHCRTTSYVSTAPSFTCRGCGRGIHQRACEGCGRINRVWGETAWKCARCSQVHRPPSSAVRCERCDRGYAVGEDDIASCSHCRSPMFRHTCRRCDTTTVVWGIGSWRCSGCRITYANPLIRVR